AGEKDETAGEDRQHAAHQGAGVITRGALVPPKPNEFDITAPTGLSLAASGTRSMSRPSDGLRRFRGGGTTWSRRARIETNASTAPAGRSRGPVAELVEDIGSLWAWGPNSRFSAPSSSWSPSGVEVPWALM